MEGNMDFMGACGSWRRWGQCGRIELVKGEGAWIR
jgi:hypothetical protein